MIKKFDSEIVKVGFSNNFIIIGTRNSKIFYVCKFFKNS